MRSGTTQLSLLALGCSSLGGILACSADPSPLPQAAVEVSFQATVGDLEASCGRDYPELGRTRAEAQLADARLYVAELELRAADGDWVALELDPSPWQAAQVTLLDFEDGSGPCSDSGTPELNARVVGHAPEGDYSGVRFRVGIPEALNHLDGSLAEPPLNVPGMFWTWQAGYRFLRADWLVTDGEVPRWNVHVGSTGCTSASAATPPSGSCAQPNLAQIELTDLDLAQDHIQIDLGALVADADLLTNVADSAPGCMGGVDEAADCAPVLGALGLAAGVCEADCAGQRVFSVRR